MAGVDVVDELPVAAEPLRARPRRHGGGVGPGGLARESNLAGPGRIGGSEQQRISAGRSVGAAKRVGLRQEVSGGALAGADVDVFGSFWLAPDHSGRPGTEHRKAVDMAVETG